MSHEYRSTFVRAESTPVIDGQTRWKPEREPVHVRATAGEIVTVGFSIGGVALAVFLILDFATKAPMSLWWTAAYVVPSVILIAIGLWTLYHYRRNEQRLDRDDYAWTTMQAKLAERDAQIRSLKDEIDRQRQVIDERDSKITAMLKANTRYVSPQPDVAEPLRAEAQNVAETARNASVRYNAAVRYIVDQWESGIKGAYTRDRCIQGGRMTGAEWTAAMDAIEAAGFVKRGGRGDGRTIVALKPGDILGKVLR